MKKLSFRKIAAAFLLFPLVMTSCTKDFQEINRDPNNTPNALPQQLLAPTIVSVMTYNQLRNRNFNNELMQVTVNMSDAEGAVFRYNFRSNWADYLWNGWYSELTNIKDIYSIANEEINYNRSYMGISLILQSWVYSFLIERSGIIPLHISISQVSGYRNIPVRQPHFDTGFHAFVVVFFRRTTDPTLHRRFRQHKLNFRIVQDLTC